LKTEFCHSGLGGLLTVCSAMETVGRIAER
jgi:hypothetical protein